MEVSCKREVNCQTNQLCTVATITVPRGTEKVIEERARKLLPTLASSSRRSGTLVLGLCGDVSEVELANALQLP